MSDNNKQCVWGCANICTECKNDPSKFKYKIVEGICEWGCAMLCTECCLDPSKRFESKNK